MLLLLLKNIATADQNNNVEKLNVIQEIKIV